MSQLNADSSDDEGVERRQLNSSSEDESEEKRREGGLGNGEDWEKKKSQVNAGSSDEDENAGDVVGKKGEKEKGPLAADSSDDDDSNDKMQTKKSTVEDSDSSVGVPQDMDPNVKVKKTLAAASSDEGGKNLSNSDSEAEGRKEKKLKKKKKVKTLVDSDDSDADISQKSEAKAVPSSSDEDEKTKGEESNSSRKTKRKMTRVVDSDSEEDKEAATDEVQLKKSKSLFANKDLYDAESSEEDDLPEPGYTSKKRGSSGSEDSGQEEEQGGAPPRPRSPKQSRKAMEKARDEIRSESARLLRESAIGLPYHRPKQRSLAEFLARKDGQPEIVSHIKATRFDPYAQQKLEQREAALKKFYKAEDGADEEEGTEKVQEGAKETEPGGAGGGQKETSGGENVTPLLSSVFDEEAAATEENDTVTDTSVKDNVARVVDKDEIMMELGEAQNLETAEETSKKPFSFAEEVPSNEETRTDENVGAAVKKNETLKLVLEDTVAEALDDTVEEKDDTVEKEKKGEEEEESLKLVLEPDTPIEEEEEIILSSQVVSRSTVTVKSSAQERLERLRKKFGDVAGLENSMNITPRVAEGADDELVFCEKGEEKLSNGAEKLFQKFITHAFAKGRKVDEEEERTVENVTIVTKKKAEDGTEVLCQEVIQYQGDEKKQKKKKAALPGAKFVSMKEKLKAQMLERRLEVRKKRVVEMKMNENELCDDLPDEEFEDDEDYNYNDEEEYMGEDEEEEEDEEGESEPEENDVDMREKKRIKNAFEDDEAEDEDMVDDEDDDESIVLNESPKKLSFKKIQENPELLSETSCASDMFKAESVRNEMETPTIANRTPLTSAPNSNSSTLQLPRWTPYQDRADVWGAQREEEMASREEGESPTSSQLAKKRLGFENLFDQTDPDVQEIDDVVDMGLLSGRFITQKPADVEKEVMRQTQADFDSSSSSRPQSRPQSRGMDTQDTVILTGASQDVSSAINRILEDVADISEEEEEESDVMGNEDLKESVVEKNSVEETAGPDLASDPESDDDKTEEEEGEGVKVSKKRKRRLISDSEGSEDEEKDPKKESEEEDNDDVDLGVIKKIDYDSDENPVVVVKPLKNRMLTKGGKLRKDFVEGEAELSGSEEGSDDEDERGLDRFEEMEGDLDDIDEDKERDKLGRIAQRMALDEDQANLKLFQDRFLEDGDLHTDYKRERQFKWAGLDDRIELGPGETQEGEGEEEESTEKWRLEKMEKERWLKEQKINEGDGDEGDKDESKFFALADRTLQRMTSKEEREEEEEGPKEKVFKSPMAKLGPLLPLQNGAMRGSFLARDADALSRLEKFNKHKEEKVGVGAKGRNFVFAAISPPKEKEVMQEEEKEEKGKKAVKGPLPKKQKLNRNLDENSRMGTIFNLL